SEQPGTSRAPTSTSKSGLTAAPLIRCRYSKPGPAAADRPDLPAGPLFPETSVQLTVIGDIHTQERKLWRMLLEAGIADAERQPTAAALKDDSWRLVLLGDVVHAKTREVYSHLAEVEDYDEYNPEHRRAAELSQEAFLRELKAFQEKLPADRLVILMGNHDFNAISPDQGPLRT